jgi:hypothetical protein
MGSCVNRVMADPDEGEALSKAKSTVTKQSAEILSLRNQVKITSMSKEDKII